MNQSKMKNFQKILAFFALILSISFIAASNPQQISNWTDLSNIRNDLSGNYILITDLSSSDSDYAGIGNNWTAIGDNSNQFSGSLDGDGNTISDLRIDSSSLNYVGLFGYLAGSVSNLGLIDVNIVTTRPYCNYNSNSNCLKDTGGIAGYSTGTISDSYVTGYIYGKESRTGGIAGGFSGTINSCYSTATMDCYDCDVGGLVGKQYGGLINNSYSRSSVSSYYYELGGLVGKQAGGVVSNSYSTGSVGGSSYDQGGFFGTGITVIESYWDVNTSGKSPRSSPFPPDIAVGKTTLEMKNKSTFSSWDVLASSNNLNDGYPYLSWQEGEYSSVWLIYEECNPNIVNSTSDWGDIDDCGTDNMVLQARNTTQYDSNFCGEVENETFSEYQNTSCDYCVPDWILNDTWGECQPTNLQFKNYYDSNSCNEETTPTSVNQSCTFTYINGSTDLNETYSGVLEVKFIQGNDVLVEFNYNFSGNQLNLTNITVEREDGSGDVKGYIFVRGIQQEGTKTLYMRNISTNFNWICIKDAEISDISEITSNCKGTNEYLVQCNNKINNGYTCEDLGDTSYKITGLQHSGVIQMASPTSGSSGGGGSGGSPSRARTPAPPRAAGPRKDTARPAPGRTRSGAPA